MQAAPALLGFGVLPGAGLGQGFGFELLEAVDHQHVEQSAQLLPGFLRVGWCGVFAAGHGAQFVLRHPAGGVLGKGLPLHVLAQGGPAQSPLFMELRFKPGKQRAVGGGQGAQHGVVFARQGFPQRHIAQQQARGVVGPAGGHGARAGVDRGLLAFVFAVAELAARRPVGVFAGPVATA